jgi:hypothetical protein
MGGPHPTSDKAESEALAYCRKTFGRGPDRVTTL